jgi:hypothetical protein
MMDDRRLLAIIDQEMTNAMGAPGGEISIERAKAWDYYLSKKLGNEVEGMSQVVASDVMEVIDSIMPVLLRMFTTADNLISFDPGGPDDEAQAAQETDYITYVFFKHIDSFELMFFWFFDALVQKNGIVKAWWDESEKVSTEKYTGLTVPEIAQLMEDDELEAVSRSEPYMKTTVINGNALMDAEVYDIEFRRVCKSGRTAVENVPPEEYRISADARHLDPGRARMVGHEREITRSDLLAMGFDEDTVESLPAVGNVDAQGSDEKISRYNKTDERGDQTSDRSQELVCLREVYIKVDYDEDGRAELRQVFCAGNKILSNEMTDRQPFHVLTPHPLPHKHFGMAAAEKVMDLQEVSTTLERQILDNLYQTNQPGHMVWDEAMTEDTLDDLMTSRPGRIVDVGRPVGEAHKELTVPFTAAQSFPMLEYFDKVKRDRTGVVAEGEALSPDALKNIQQSVLGSAMDVSRMKIEAICRIFAETGIKSLFRHLHELQRKHQDKASVVKLRGQWVPVDPSGWRTRYDVTVNIGLGIGTREQNMIHLNDIWQKQKEVIEAGGMGLLVTPDNIHETLTSVVKNATANLGQPGRFFTDPKGQPAPPPNQEQMRLQQEQQALQKQQQEMIQRQQQLEMQKMQLDRERDQMRHEREINKMVADNRVKVAELEQRKQEQDDKIMVEMEKIATQLTQLELNSGTNVPGSKV